MEMEKRGEIVTTKFDSSWLPDFGRVWQSGSRKESKKEFQVEINTSHKDESQAVTPAELQPYVSKRQVSSNSHLMAIKAICCHLSLSYFIRDVWGVITCNFILKKDILILPKFGEYMLIFM